MAQTEPPAPPGQHLQPLPAILSRLSPGRPAETLSSARSTADTPKRPSSRSAPALPLEPRPTPDFLRHHSPRGLPQGWRRPSRWRRPPSAGFNPDSPQEASLKVGPGCPTGNLSSAGLPLPTLPKRQSSRSAPSVRLEPLSSTRPGPRSARAPEAPLPTRAFLSILLTLTAQRRPAGARTSGALASPGPHNLDGPST